MEKPRGSSGVSGLKGGSEIFVCVPMNREAE